VRAPVESALAELKRLAENGTAAEIKPALDRVDEAAKQLAEATARAAAGARTDESSGNGHSSSGAGAARSHGDDVIDAEFKES
jgi:hypothetical protein